MSTVQATSPGEVQNFSEVVVTLDGLLDDSIRAARYTIGVPRRIRKRHVAPHLGRGSPPCAARPAAGIRSSRRSPASELDGQSPALSWRPYGPRPVTTVAPQPRGERDGIARLVAAAERVREPRPRSSRPRRRCPRRGRLAGAAANGPPGCAQPPSVPYVATTEPRRWTQVAGLVTLARVGRAADERVEQDSRARWSVGSSRAVATTHACVSRLPHAAPSPCEVDALAADGSSSDGSEILVVVSLAAKACRRCTVIVRSPASSTNVMPRRCGSRPPGDVHAPRRAPPAPRARGVRARRRRAP